MSALIEQLLDRRHALALLTLLLGAAVIAGIQHTSLDSSSSAILIDGDPYKAEVDEVRESFPATSSVLFVFEAEPDVFSFEALRAMEALDQRFTEIDSAIAVGSLINRRLSDTDAERYDRDFLIPELNRLTDADLAEIRAIALADEDLTRSLLSPSGDMALAQLKYSPGTDEQAVRLEIARSILAFRDSLREEFPDVQIYTLGGVLFEWDGYQAQIKDSHLLMPLVIGVAIALLWMCLKSLSFSFGLFLVAFATVGLTVGTYGWLRIPLNQISNLGPLVVFVVAIAHGIHLVSIYAQGLHQGLEKLAAMRESLLINLQPVTLATITTAMGFLSLNYCTSPGIYGFGNIVAIGVVWAYILSITLLPAVILLMPVAKTPKPLGIRIFIEQVTELVEKRGPPLFWGCTVLIVATLLMLPLNRMDFDRLSFVDEESDLHHVMTALAEKIGNDQSLVYGIFSDAYYGITEPDFLRQVDELSRWLETQPEASFVASYTDLLRSMNLSEHNDDPTFDRLPEDKLQIIDYLVSYQLIQEIEPSLEPIFSTDFSAIRLVVGTSDLSNAQLVAFNDRIEQWVAANVDPKYRVLHGDNSILGARLNQAITRELMEGFTVSILLITLTLIIGLKSLRYGLLSVIPNLFPATIVFGFWGLLVGEIGPYVLMLFSISIGLVVDDSVHILSKYITGLRQGLSPERAVRYSLDKAGSAITITTLSLAVGTFILVFSNTFYFQNVALLLTPIILAALLLDLLFLPPLLIMFDRRWGTARPKGSTEDGSAEDRSTISV